MNKVQQINLGGVPFTIDEDAYEHLSRYLETIHRHFKDSEGYEEITSDIEARMAELFQESLGERIIITTKDVRDAIVIMGTPEDFGAEPIDDEPAAAASARDRSYRPGKRLFRNPDDEVLGGVCSGIAAYFGIEDPLWVRLAFIIITISGGFGIPAYLILWAIVPQAETASDRLAMRGEPITASNIGRIIEEEFNHLSEKVSELGSELGGKKKEFSADGGSNLGDALRKGVMLIGSAIRVVLQMIGKLWKPLLLLIGGALILAFTVSWITTVAGVVFAWPWLEYFSPEWPFLSVLGAFNTLMVIGIVLLALVLSITRLLYGARMSGSWRAGLTGFWILNIISFFLVASLLARDFSYGATVDDTVSFSGPADNTLKLEMGEKRNTDGWFNLDEELVLVDGGLLSRQVEIDLLKGEGDEFVLEQHFSARGSNQSDAEQLARMVQYEPSFEGNTLTFPAEFVIPQGSKWRVQEVKLVLKIPVGKTIHMGEEVRFYVEDADKKTRVPLMYHNPNTAWTMTEEGLVCQNCTGGLEEDEEYRSFEGFRNVSIEGKIEAVITGAEEYEVRLAGKEALRQQVEIEQMGELLVIKTPLQQTSSPIRLFIATPFLDQLEVENTGNINLKGFGAGSLQLAVKGRQELKADLRPDTLILMQEGHSKVDLRGRYSYLKANLSGESRLDAEKASVSEAEIHTTGSSRALMGSVPKIAQQAEGSSRISVKEN